MDPNAPITFQPQQTWDVLDAHFKDSSVLVEAQVLSYENMVNVWLPQLLQQSGFEVYSKGKSSKVKFEVIKCAICKPTQYVNRQGNRPLSPRDARNNNITYSAKLYLDFAVTLTTSDNKTERWVETRVAVCGIPAMIKSSVCHLHGRSSAETTALGECPYDLGGYFIVSGSEKVIISQERPVENIITVFPENDPSKPYVGRAEVKSSIDQRFFPIKTTVIKLAKTMALHIFLPHGRNPVPLGVVFKALGVISDKQIMEYLMDYEDEANVDLLNVMTATIEESKAVLTQNDAIRLVSNSININIDPKDAGDQVPDDLLVNFRMTFAANLLNREFLPHVGNDPDKKLKFISLMVTHLLDAYRDESKYTDRDKLTNKRLNLAGPLLAQIFSHWWGNTIKEIKLTFARCLSDENKSSYPQDVRRILQKSNIEKKLNYSLSTGNWYTTRAQANSAAKKGIAQVLQRMSATGTISHLRRLSSPLERSGSKHEPPRRLHGTQVPKICPNETPEGAQVGTVKNLALLTHVSTETNAEPAAYCLRRLGMLLIEDVSPMHQHKMTKVIVNGQLMGLIETTQKANEIYLAMRYFKRTGIINKFISVSWLHDEMTLKIFTDGGRYMVPYFIVDEDNHLGVDLWVNAAIAARVKFETLGLTDLSSVMPEDMSKAAEGIYTSAFNADKGKGAAYNFKLHKQAAVEYLDTDEDENCMLADTVDRLYDGQTFRPGDDDRMMYAHLTRSLNLKDVTDSGADLAQLIVDQVKLNRPEMADSLKEILESAVIYNAKTRDCRLTLTGSFSRLTELQQLVVTNLNRYLSGSYIRYTHCLVHPSQINGVVATNIPFSDHNPSPRNCYQSSMGKQALGIFMTNYESRWDTMGNILIYPQVPIAACRTAKYAGLDRLHHGATVMLAINTYSGYNQEDSLIGNKDSAKRGCFNNLFYRTYTSRLRRLTTTQNDAVETFEVPPAEGTIGRKMGMLGKNRYHAIVTNPAKVNGNKSASPELPALGTIVEGGDVIIPKSRKELKDRTKKGGPYVYSDNSTTVRPSEGGVVDKIIPSEEYPNNEDEEGYRIVKVRLCELRQPEIGDKFASRAAQKGTEGIQYNSADICQTQDGVRPEKIMNPHAIPSRMTLGQLLEAKCAKYGVMTGTYMDTTPFTEFNNDELSEKFKQLGYDYACDELMYNGFTGDMLGLVNITPTYYQRLKHMVADKIHARALGPIQSLTKQPAEGRARGGGLRIGEMERDSLLAHGAVMTLKEKLCDSSDIAEFYVSREKQVPISANPKLGIFQHGNEEVYEDDIRRVHMPYAMELLRKEMVQGMINMQYNFTA
jgi:DNA-directed RNA polymerase beta subunit